MIITGKKNLLAKILHKSGLLSTIGKLNASFSKRITILAYHRVFDIDDENNFPFDPELISASTQSFSAQIDYIQKHFNPVTFKDVIQYLDEKKNLPKRPIIITFDDGYKDNYTNAYPILKSRQIPATIFLSTNYIGTNRTFWFDWVAYAIFKTNKEEISFSNNKCFLIGHDIESRRECTSKLLNYLKRIPNKTRIKYLNEMEQQFEIEIAIEDKPHSSYLDWEQVIEMHKNGIEIGSHTASHPILSQLSKHELEVELSKSKLEIEKHVNCKINVISYPEGGVGAYTKEVIETCKLAGYRLGLSYIPGAEPINTLNLFEIKRLHVERDINMEYFRSMLELPQIFK